jgi:acetolactate synthase-1/2/3 large subunit
MATGAEIIARRLSEAGFRYAFGMPGGEVLALLDALDRASLRFVLVKHENAAGFMAEGAWHAGGGPGVLLATVGPGVANCVNVVANAHQDRVPLIVLTGRVDPAEAETYTHQVFDHQALMRPITKASLLAPRGAVDVVISRAITLALSGQPGPVHVDVPIGVADGEEPAAAIPARPLAITPAAPVGGEALQRARALIASSVRPLVIAGVDAVNEGAGAAVEAFCRALGAPLITTYKAKGLIDERDPLALGGAGLSPKADRRLLPLIREADAIILAGYDPIEMRINWRDPWPDAARVVSVTATLPLHYMHQAGINLVGAIAPTLALLGGREGRQAWADGAPASVRAGLQADFAPEDHWGPGVVFDVLRRLAPDDTVLTADSGAHRILLSQQWRCRGPRGLLQSSALCTMGSALPIAIGHALADPSRPVVAVMGDAGCEMVLGELATLRDLDLPVIVLVLQDASLALIEMKQRQMQRPSVGVDFGASDFAAVATAMGGRGVMVRDRAALEEALREAFARRRGFSLIAAAIGARAYDGRI